MVYKALKEGEELKNGDQVLFSGIWAELLLRDDQCEYASAGVKYRRVLSWYVIYQRGENIIHDNGASDTETGDITTERFESKEELTTWIREQRAKTHKGDIFDLVFAGKVTEDLL